jgi:hypothetical protein
MFSATGCIYAIRRSLVQALAPDTLSDDVMIPLGAFFRGYRVILDPQALAFDYPTAEGKEFRRKLRTLAGVWQVYSRKPELFTAANRMRLHFLSHRFSRLVLPWALLLFCAATLALPSGILRTALLATEAGAALLALFDGVIPKGWALKKLTSPAHTFAAMNAAALAAVLVFFVQPSKLWQPTQVKVRQT